MNQSRFTTLAAAAAALASQMALASGAKAGVVPIIQDSTLGSTLVAIDGLDVDGTSYDVTFLHDNAHNRPVPKFADYSEAYAASQTLGGELVQLENEYLGSNPPSSLSDWGWR